MSATRQLVRLGTRLRDEGESGFTLVELLVVMAIIGIMVAIAVPSYLGFTGRAADRAAVGNLRQALPSVEAYYADTGSYAGMTVTKLRSGYDSGVSSSLAIYGTPTTTYCLTENVAGHVWSVRGPGASTSSYVANGTCS